MVFVFMYCDALCDCCCFWWCFLSLVLLKRCFGWVLLVALGYVWEWFLCGVVVWDGICLVVLFCDSLRDD